MTKVNDDIRDAMSQRRVFQWHVAEILGMSEWTLVRKLRHELDNDMKKKLMEAIMKAEAKYR